ncbi:MAG: hypothetical protein NVS3B26_25170 [Mycobacteriales bacterium]
MTGRENEVKAPRTPLYPRLLRLRHIAPNAWQRALLGEGALACAAVLVLADLATAWTLLVLPLATAAVVKAHDVLAGLLASASPGGGSPAPQAAAGAAGLRQTADSAGSSQEPAPQRKDGSALRGT